MIDKRFSLTKSPLRPDLFDLTFDVVLPDRCLYSQDEILKVCTQQYPELRFSCTGCYQAKFLDGQYATAVKHIVGSYLVKLHFSMQLQLDTIIEKCCAFRPHVPPIKFNVDPEALINLTPEDFQTEIENMYALQHKMSLRIRDVSWEYAGFDGEPVYLLTPIDYDYI